MLNRLCRFFLIVTVFFSVSKPSIVGAGSPALAQAELKLVETSDHLVRLVLSTPSYTISPLDNKTSDAVEIIIPGISNDETPTELHLPRLSRLVAIPPGVDVQLSYNSPEMHELRGKYHLLIGGGPQALVEELTPGYSLPDEVFTPPEDVKIGIQPSEPVRISSDAWQRSQRVVRVDLFPFQYDPVQSTLIWHPILDVTLTFIPNRAVQRLPDSAELFPSSLDHLTENAVINPQSARLWQDPFWQSLAEIPLARSLSTTNYDESRYKISVNEDGLYEVTGEDLLAAGLDLQQIDPQDFSISNQGVPFAFLVMDVDGNNGEVDGIFDLTDRIVFYGEKFRGERMAERYASEDDLWAMMPTGWQPHMSAEMFEKYTDKNVYWLDVNGPAGLRMDVVNGIPTGAHLILTQSRAKTRLEQDNRWYTVHRTDEDSWFWEVVSVNTTTPGTTRMYPFDLPTATESATPAVLLGEIYADTESLTSTPDHHIELAINGNSIYVAEWDGIGRLSMNVEFDQSYLIPGTNQLTLTSSLLTGRSSDSLFIDWFEIAYAHQLQAQADQLFFEYPESGTVRQYRIGGFSSANIAVLDITNPLEPIVVEIQPGIQQGSTYQAEFIAQHPQTARYLVTSTSLEKPLAIEQYSFKNLHASTFGADYIIIAHPNFVSTAQALADYRSAQGLRTMVVDIEDIINEFNDGIYHSLAIKSFLAYTMVNWIPPAPSYVVLVGSGHWNFYYRPGPTNNYSTAEIYMPPHLAWVDPWQGEVDSAAALAMVVGNDLLPDLAIGRIPVDSSEELATVISKIIAYEDQDNYVRPDRLLFVADNQPDLAGNFANISDDVIDASVPAYQNIDRVYLNDFLDQAGEDACEPGMICPQATQAILDHINNTELDFINYTGHGSINYWAQELLLRTTSLPDYINDPSWNDLVLMNNGDNLPVLLSMTCLDGYWIYPSQRYPSLAVNLLRKTGGGIVAAYSPTGLGLAHGHDVLNKAFFDSLYKIGVKELGAAVQFSKLKLFETGQNFDLIYTYTIFGDPALRLKTTSGGVFIPYVSNQVIP